MRDQLVELFERAGIEKKIDALARRQLARGVLPIEAARLGADVVTVPSAVIDSLFKHPLTDIGLERFLKDWEKAQGAKV